MLQEKGRNVNSAKIIIGVDYKRVCKKIIKETLKPNVHAQESGAEIALIKQLIEKMNFAVEFKLFRGHTKGVVR